MSKHYKESNEAFWWALFGAGGVVSALFIPVLLILIGLAIPLGWLPAPDYESIHSFVANPLVRLVLFGVVTMSMFHWAHRFRFTLYDGLQLKHLEALIVVLTYGVAIISTILAAVVMWTF